MYYFENKLYICYLICMCITILLYMATETIIYCTIYYNGINIICIIIILLI